MSRLEELGDRIESRDALMGVIGLGYVGLPLAIALSKAGFQVTGIDVDGEKIRQLEVNSSYIEDVPSSEIATARSEGRFEASSDFSVLTRLDVIHICVPTPLTRSKDPDVSYMAKAVEEIRRRLRSGQLVILGSTTYPGTTHDLFVPMLEETGLRVGEDFCLAFAPERIDPANQDFEIREIPKVVGGETPKCRDLARQVFETVFDKVVPVSSTQSAEMVKLLENTFRAINIGLANEVALMCRRLGLDVWEVIEAAATKPYGFMKFLPGPGLGGHCIPVDPSYLAWKMKSLNFPARFIDVATEINTHMPEHVVERVGELLNQERLAVNGSRILILGVSYKRDVGDLRESPSLDVIKLLAEKGGDISFHDPFVGECEVEGAVYKTVDLDEAVLSESDLVVILTDHREVDYDLVAAKTARIFDTRNAMKDIENPRAQITKL